MGLGVMQIHSLWALALDQKLEGHQWHEKNMKFWPQSKCQGTASS